MFFFLFSSNAYMLDMSKKKDRMILRRSRHELYTQLSLAKRCLPLGIMQKEIYQRLQYENTSLEEQYARYKTICANNWCVFCKDTTLSFAEQLRHEDYHVQKRLLGLREDQAYDDTIRCASIATEKILNRKINNLQNGKFDNHSNDLLRNTCEKAYNNVNFQIIKQERKVAKLFDHIKDSIFFHSESIEKEPKPLRLLWEDTDNTHCFGCNEILKVTIDRSQEDDFAYEIKTAVRIKNKIYCRKECIDNS